MLFHFNAFFQINSMQPNVFIYKLLDEKIVTARRLADSSENPGEAVVQSLVPEL
jgi:hypothetical protein